MAINNEKSYNPQQFTISLPAEWWSAVCYGDVVFPYSLSAPLQLHGGEEHGSRESRQYQKDNPKY